MTQDDFPPVLRPDECAKMLRIPLRTFYDLLNRGDIPGARRFGKCWRIDRNAVLASMAGNPASCSPKR